MDSPGRRRTISRRTVRPPTPESKTPIGRASATASAPAGDGCGTAAAPATAAAMLAMSRLIGASGFAMTNGMPSLLACTTSLPSETMLCSGTRPRARARSSAAMPPVESARLTTKRTFEGG